ncbi:MAG: gamma carbonic anhydrase family protein [Cytophagales bacterium]|nr:gamma carbonic anhydrase family protein [Cytophagales bacterium]
MAIIKRVNEKSPVLGTGCWLADTAVVVGEVEMGKNCTVWFGTVLRGDVHFIKVGDNTNIQDNATIHCTYKKAPTTIGSNVSIGHNAVVHGCTLEDNVLVGMGAIVMDHALVKQGAIIAAGAVVLENTVVEENCIYAGVPAKKVKEMNGENIEMMKRIASNYVKYASWFKEGEE